MLKKYSLKALQKAINLALSLDAQLPQKLWPLQGKILKIIINPLDVSFFIQFEETSLRLLDHYEGFPDASIKSSPIGLIRLSLLPPSKARSLFNDKVEITGDIALGQQVKQLFDTLDLDWEGHLAHFTGDVIAHQIGSWIERGRQFHESLQQSMQANVSEYLQEEIRVLPTKTELDEFFTMVDELSLRVERLIAHVQLLQDKTS